MSEEPERLCAALAVADPPGIAPVVATLRDGVESVLRPAAPGGLTWEMGVIRRRDDIAQRRPRHMAWLGLDDEDLEFVWVSGRDPSAAGSPRELVASAVAELPRPGGMPDGSIMRLAAVVALSLQLPALGGSVPAEVGAATLTWLRDGCAALGADAGMLVVDRLDAHPGFETAWERAVELPRSKRDVATHAWGYGWGTLLSAAAVERLGDRDALHGLPGRAETWPGGTTWLQLPGPPEHVAGDDLRALRDALRPVLPEGYQPPEDYDGVPPLRL